MSAIPAIISSVATAAIAAGQTATDVSFTGESEFVAYQNFAKEAVSSAITYGEVLEIFIPAIAIILIAVCIFSLIVR